MKQHVMSDTLGVITSFPSEASGNQKRGFNAVGWHSERLLTALARKRTITVFAEKLPGSQTIHLGKNLVVKRTWEKGNIISLFALARKLHKSTITDILVQFEFNVFGGILPNLALLLSLLVLRMSGKHVTFELHQVITDIKKLEKHINITNPVLQLFFNVSLRIFYVVLGLIVSDIIVFEEDLKIKLSSFVKEHKIHVLSLGVIPVKTLSKAAARKKLGLSQSEYIVLVFGFINGYKGIDWIMEHMAAAKLPNTRLLIVGGENPYLKDKAFYQRFYGKITQAIAKHSDFITHTGFVADESVQDYFAAADVAILPYTVFMSASGPFSHALSYQTPILLSEKLLDYSKSCDFDNALTIAGLSRSDMFFKLNKTELSTLLLRAQKDTTYERQLTKFAQTLGNLRSMDSVVHRLNTITTNASYPAKKRLAVQVS